MSDSHGSHGSHDSHGSHGSQCSQCCCAEEMAEQLEKNRGKRVAVFEKNAVITGTIKEVKDDKVLVLTDVFKFQAFGNAQVIIVVEKLFVSICEITEFAPIDSGGAGGLLTAAQQMGATRLI
ncbi:hypothetical protein ACSU6B_28675 [Neobacillus sp. C211]|uniref:hypothetical protein n=1 Tax=unclassified Neobacillus TaxID=2675272 RepID=UPI00397C850A